MIPLENANISKNTRLFVRCDLDVPIESGNILETFRLDRCIPTLKYIIQKDAFPIIAGHIGKPEGKYVEELSTKHLLPYFNKILGENKFKLLENLRFDPREEENSKEYAQELAMLADMYVNESFASSHREHTSIVSIPKILPSYAGINLVKEINTLENLLDNPKRPLVVIIGGAKLESKKPVIDKFLRFSDYVLIGGKIGLDWKEDIPSNLILPLDYAYDNKDIGTKTIEKFKEIIQDAKTILWAGPLGVYEKEEYLLGTKEVGNAILSNTNVFSVIGGGDTITAINKFSSIYKFSFVSTGGGAMLEFLANKSLCGIEALNKYE